MTKYLLAVVTLLAVFTRASAEEVTPPLLVAEAASQVSAAPPVTLPPAKCEPVACTPVKCEPVACTPVACAPVACTPVACIPVKTPEMLCDEDPNSTESLCLTRRLTAKRAMSLSQQIDYFREAVKASNQEKGLLSRLFSSAINPLDTELLAEMQRFTQRNAESSQTDEVYFMLGQVHKRIKNYPAAALDWLLLKAMYPRSTFIPQVNKLLKELIADEFSKQANVLEKLNKLTSTLSGDVHQRAAEFLIALAATQDETLAPSILVVLDNFLQRNTTYQNEDVIESAVAHQASLLDNDVALYHFSKLLSIYPSSRLRAESWLAMATIQREKLKLYDKAVKSYQMLIEKHPDASETQQGYEALAAMYSEDMRDYPNAIKTLNAIIAKYKKDPIVLRSLLALEKLYETRTSQPEKAIETYLRIAELYAQGDEGMSALVAAEALAMNATKNWNQAMSINKKIMQRAPDSEFALKAEFANAEITETKLGDRAKAKEMYDEFCEHHPKHALFKEAQKRIEAMLKK